MRNLRLIAGLLVLLGAGLAQAETCITLDRPGIDRDNVDFLIAPTALEVAAVTCHCDGDCVAPVLTFEFSDRAGNVISLSGALTCSTGMANSTWVSVSGGDPDRNLVTGEGLEVSVPSTSQGSFDFYTVCVRFA